MGTSLFAQFPSIGIIGDATPTGWDSDTDLTTTDGVIYTIDNFTLTAGTVKFRQDNSWDNNWGGTTWPSGTGVFNSSTNIPSQPGLYNITFNLDTKEYNFENAGNFSSVDVMGGGATFTMYTTDGITYYSDNVTFDVQTSVQFSVDEGAGMGGNGFPDGTATAGGSVSVPANSYNIVYNIDTGEYMFNFVTISLTGTGVQDWGVDADFTTTDGFSYTLNSYTFQDGEVKFRLNHDWGVTWGNASFPSGTATVVGNGGNIAIPAGTYAVTFNRSTGDFAFTEPTAGTANFSLSALVAYPNPTVGAWTFNAGSDTIDTITLTDISGKVIYSQNVNASQAVVNAGQWAKGIYLACITSGSRVKNIKLVKN